jgi:hypothetical protein
MTDPPPLHHQTIRTPSAVEPISSLFYKLTSRACWLVDAGEAYYGNGMNASTTDGVDDSATAVLAEVFPAAPPSTLRAALKSAEGDVQAAVSSLLALQSTTHTDVPRSRGAKPSARQAGRGRGRGGGGGGWSAVTQQQRQLAERQRPTGGAAAPSGPQYRKRAEQQVRSRKQHDLRAWFTPLALILTSIYQSVCLQTFRKCSPLFHSSPFIYPSIHSFVT